MMSVVDKSTSCSEKNTECSRLKVGIVGASGYTGLLLLHLLKSHPLVDVVCVTARQYAGQLMSAVFPSVLDRQLRFVDVDQDLSPLMACQLVFLATPHGVSMAMVPALLQAGVRVIDLSADFRLQDAALWQDWYHQPHTAPTYLAEAVYGLTEHYRKQVVSARLIANPGCYPTAVQLALWPLLKHQLIEPAGIVIDAKSGVSGAGRQAKTNLLASEVIGSFKAYGGEGHRHWPEIHQGLSAMLPEDRRQALSMTFLPHLVPMVRGIEASIYVLPRASIQDCQQALEEAYQEAFFVQVMQGFPDSKSVQGTNHCQIGIAQQKGSPHLVISSVIDNLIKGAAGQAIQNMNVMMGWTESLALQNLVPMVP
jgi:N-acetyl-gamma-glutamyl-phosphate reductase